MAPDCHDMGVSTNHVVGRFTLPGVEGQSDTLQACNGEWASAPLRHSRHFEIAIHTNLFTTANGCGTLSTRFRSTRPEHEK